MDWVDIGVIVGLAIYLWNFPWIEGMFGDE